MDAKRWSNVLSVARAFRSGHPRAGRGPREAYIEVAACCNLSCRMCPLTVDPRYAPGSGRPRFLSEELFERLEPLFPTLQRAHLFGLGEPLLHPRLCDFARRLTAAGVEVWTTTNATRIDLVKAEELAAAGFDRITVSLDGARAETYEAIRRGGRFADALRGLRALAAVRGRRGRPRLHVNVVVMAANLEEVPEIVDLCTEVGADGLFLEKLYDWQHPELAVRAREQDPCRRGESRLGEVLTDCRRRAAEAGLGFSISPALGAEPGRARIGAPAPGSPPRPPEPRAHRRPPRLPFPCCEPWSTIVVNTYGEVRTCCFNDTVLGRLDRQPFAEIWRGEPYAALRRSHAALEVPGGCSGCVADGRVKRSPFLAAAPTTASPVTPNGRGTVEAPGELELSGDPLVVTGRLARAGAVWAGWRSPPPELPEVYLDGHLLARVSDLGVLDGDRFAVVIPVPFVRPGTHRLRVASGSGDGGRVWSEREILVGPVSVDPRALAGVHRVAVAVDLERRERRPRLLLGGSRHPIASWICGTWGTAYRGVAVIDVGGLRPGTYAMELRLRHHRPLRRLLHRLAVEGSFGFGRSPRRIAAL